MRDITQVKRAYHLGVRMARMPGALTFIRNEHVAEELGSMLYVGDFWLGVLDRTILDNIDTIEDYEAGSLFSLRHLG